MWRVIDNHHAHNTDSIGGRSDKNKFLLCIGVNMITVVIMKTRQTFTFTMKTTKNFRIMLLMAVSFSLIFLTSCDKRIRKNGSGVVTSNTRSMAEFEEVDVDGSYELFIHEDDQHKVVVETDDNIQDEVQTFVQNGILHVEMSDDYMNYHYTRMEIHIYGNDFSLLDLHGSVNVTSVDTIHAADFELRHNGSGHSNITFDGQDVKLNINGSGRIEANGHADECTLVINGSGKIDALDLPVLHARGEIHGSGDLFLNASESLDAVIDGSGDIRYLGTPTVNSQISGSGSIAPY
jgi:Putative auto-transporter adhesin, head GIN domain